MRVRLSIILTFALLISSNAFSSRKESTKLLRSPAISETQIAFIYAGDLWVADRDGSNPERLTIHTGLESHPHFSPDGKFIAFTGDYDGNKDVFVIPAEGGIPKRLTYHSDYDFVEGWTPDGESILFRSSRDNYSYRFKRLYKISAGGGFPEVLPMPMAEHGSISEDSKFVAYTQQRDAFHTWKHYRGGRTAKIWIFDMKTHEIEEVPRGNSNDTMPFWLGDKVYFLSDREWTMNLFCFDAKTKTVEQLTYHDIYDVKSASGYKNTIIYEQAGKLHTYDLATDTESELDIYIDPDLPSIRPKFENVSKYIQNFSISPTGKRALFEARGDLFTVPAEKGSIRNLTKTSLYHERYPAWSPDGSKIAYFSDEDGKYMLTTIDQKGSEPQKKFELDDEAYYFLTQWSPDNKKILYVNNIATLFYYDFEKHKNIEVDQNKVNSPWISPVWSPDSKYIAYLKRLDNGYHAIYVCNIEKSDIRRITDGMSEVASPTWSKDGKYLYFTASTNFGLHNNALEMSEFERPFDRSIYVAILDKETENPFKPESDDEEIEEPKKEKDKKEKDKDKEDEEEESEELVVKIDFEGLDQRILALPVGESGYESLQTADGGKLFYLEENKSGDKYTLHYYDMEERESKEFMSGIDAYEISADGKKMIYKSGKQYGIVDASGTAKVGDGALSLDGMKSYIIPREEWKQMFMETWRIEAFLFYDPKMHGVDWYKVKEKYERFLPHVNHRDDLTYLQGEMIGELCVGHAYVWGGDYPDVEKVNVGMLGADFEVVDNHYRFKKIYSGLNWNPDLRAPLTEPGVDVEEGEYLIAVDGVKLSYPTNVYSLFQNKAGKQITILVSDKPSFENSREVTVVPVKGDRGLRYRFWVESNREYVDKKTKGKVAYVYMPNTTWAGYNSFNRYYFAQLDKKAVILDERWNGGGKAADYVIDLLDRQLMNWWVTRSGRPWATPGACIFGPKVMIINESAGSGGDALPAYFRRSGLGKLVGKRTWGGLVGIDYIIPLMDGGGVSAPSFAILSPDGEWEIENHGVEPDIEVEMTPKLVIDGKDPQLDKAIEVILQELEENPPPEPQIPRKKPLRGMQQ